MKARSFRTGRSPNLFGRIFSHSDPLGASDAGPVLNASGCEQVTRLLCASAFLNGRWFTNKVLSFYERKQISVAPEFGVNIPIVVRACLRAEEWEKSFQKHYVLALVAAIASYIIAINASEVIGLLGIGLAWAYASIVQNRHSSQCWEIAQSFRRAGFSLSHAARWFSQEIDPELSVSLPRKDQNLILYSGFHPFIGWGTDVGGWSIATSVNKKREGCASSAIAPFALRELYNAIDSSLFDLKLGNLSVRSYFFVSGTDVRDDPQIFPNWPGRPSQSLSEANAAAYIEGDDLRIRHYKCVQNEEWGGELIVSLLYRCVKRGETLYIEFKQFVLPPLSNEYRRVDTVGDKGNAARFFASIFAGPVYALLSPLAWSRSHGDEKTYEEIEEDRLFDFGARTTLRSDLSKPAFVHYFQKPDADFCVKIIERAILDAVVNFLDSRGIDTSDIRERKTTILNHGIFVQGGDVSAENISVGKKAKSKTVDRVASMAKGS